MHYRHLVALVDSHGQSLATSKSAVMRGINEDGVVVVIKRSESIRTMAEAVRHTLAYVANPDDVVPILDHYVEGDQYCLVTQWCTGGDLFTHYQQWGELLTNYAAHVAVVTAIKCVHFCRQLATMDEPLVHRDLKPENLFLTRKVIHPNDLQCHDIRIGDFEFCAPIGSTRRCTGTEPFIPPEWYDDDDQQDCQNDHHQQDRHHHNRVDEKHDMWSIGMIVLDILHPAAVIAYQRANPHLERSCHKPLSTQVDKPPSTQVDKPPMQVDKVSIKPPIKPPSTRFAINKLKALSPKHPHHTAALVLATALPRMLALSPADRLTFAELSL